MLGMRFHNCGGHSNMIYTTFILFQWPITSSVDVSAFTLFFFLVIYSSVCWYHNTKLHILWLKYIRDSSNVTTLSWRIFFRGVKWKGHCCLFVKSDYILPLMLPYFTADSNIKKKKKNHVFLHNIFVSPAELHRKVFVFLQWWWLGSILTSIPVIVYFCAAFLIGSRAGATFQHSCFPATSSSKTSVPR